MTATNQTTDHSANVSPEKLRKIMLRVERLLAIADSPGATPDEAATARQQAETYMTQYRIAEANLDATEKARMGIRPTSRKWDICPSNSEFLTEYRLMAMYIVSHIDGMAVSSHRWEDGTAGIYVLEVFGFESDIAYGEMLWNSARIAFGKRLEPTVDPALDDIDNVYAMRCAGMERGRIGIIMGWGGEGTKGPGKVTRLFKQACERHGEDPKVLTGKGNNMKTFRVSYAKAFADELWSMLWNLQTQRGLDSAGTLVLASRKDEIVEALYTKYPSLRPRPVDPSAKPRRLPKYKAPKQGPVNYAAAERGRKAAREIDLGYAAKGKLEA
jgi:hypothetical protein